MIINPNFNEQIALKRIAKLLSIFKHFRKDIDIVGSLHYPRILYKNNLLHTHISNFNLHFLDQPSINKNNKIVKTIKVNYLNIIDIDWFTKYLEMYGISKVFFIKYNNTDLYLSDVRFRSIGLQGLDPQEEYFLFSKYNKKFFFTEAEANQFLLRYGKVQDVNLKVVS